MEDNSIKYIVYCTTNIINNKIYIGVHKTNPTFFDGYLGNGIYSNISSSYKNNKNYFGKAVNKYGPKKFIRSTIKIFPNSEEGKIQAYAFEKSIVNEDFLQRQDVYNIALGGIIGGQIVQRIPCYIYDKNGEFVKEYSSYFEAAKGLNRNLRSVQRAITNKTKCANFYITNIKFDKLDLGLMHNYKSKEEKPIYQYDKYGNFDCCYNSINDVTRITNIDNAQIYQSIKYGFQVHNKYFSYIYCDKFEQSRTEFIKSQKVYQYDIDGIFVNEYKNMQEAKNILKIKTNIYKAIKMNTMAGGYQWRFDKFEKIAPAKKISGRPRKVGKYDKNWNLIKIYNTVSECKKDNSSSIIHVLQGRNEFSKGFRYKYID